MDKSNFRTAKRQKEAKTPTAPKLALQNTAPANCVKHILQKRGFKIAVPTDQVLQELDITLHRFNKILDNKVEITLTEAAAFANWLKVSIEELTTAPTPVPVADKFGLDI